MIPPPWLLIGPVLCSLNVWPDPKLALGTLFPVKSYLRWVFSDVFRSRPQVSQVQIKVVIKMAVDSGSFSLAFPTWESKQNEDLILDPENVWKVRNLHPKKSIWIFFLEILKNRATISLHSHQTASPQHWSHSEKALCSPVWRTLVSSDNSPLPVCFPWPCRHLSFQSLLWANCLAYRVKTPVCAHSLHQRMKDVCSPIISRLGSLIKPS